jgi:hypothetical protein
MSMVVRVELVSELELIIGGRHVRGGELVVIHVLCIDDNGLENTYDTRDLWLSVYGAVKRVVNVRKKGDHASVIWLGERICDA